MRERKNTMAVAMSLVLALILAACAGTSGTAITDTPERYTEQAPAVDPVTVPVDDPAAESDTGSDPDWQESQAQETEPVESDPAVNASETDSGTDMSSVEAVAKLASLTGTGELASCRLHDTVDVNDSHNPYDLVWQYGDKAAEKGDEFGKFYASYVDAADWSLVFDAEYYKKAFPMLAKLYHQDDALLLEHFQTVGVHEGRQGSEGFNVSVYMSNCGKDLLDAFGDNYECYYFYYMLNYASEGKADTADTYGKDPLWLDLDLTQAQKGELDAVNRYRDEVGAEPLELDPENIAFANYRAWYNAVNSVRGHGWLSDTENPDVDVVFDILGVNHLSENTVTLTGSAGKDSTLMPYYVSYRYSEDHYEAMVRPDFLYLGVSHMYYNGDTRWMCEFDTFLYTRSVPDYTMR